MSPPLSVGSAPLDAETIAALKLEIAKPRMSADKLRQRLVPPVSGATFWRALHGQKVSRAVQDACIAMARTIQADPHKPIVFKPRVYHSPTDDLRDVHALIEDAYDFDPDPEVA